MIQKWTLPGLILFSLFLAGCGGAAGGAVASLVNDDSKNPVPPPSSPPSLPSITSITPSFGPSTGGTSVTITGKNFIKGSTNVSIGGLGVANLNVVSSTQITFITLSGTEGDKNVSLSTSEGTATFIKGYTYHDAPVISTVSPSRGSTSGGETITITGDNFVNGNTTVNIGSSSLLNVSIDSDTQITGVAPPGAEGSQSISITTPGGTTTLSSGYTYDAPPTVSSISPNIGSNVGGTSVTIAGSNFVDGHTTVTIGGSSVSNLNVVSATQITANTPSGTKGDVDVVVTTTGGTATLTNGYEYTNAPIISSLTPTQGPSAGGTSVTVTGFNFITGSTSATVGGNGVSNLNVVSSTQLTFDTPTGTAGTANVVVTTSAGSATKLNGFTYYEAPTISSISPAAGSTSGGTSVLIKGSNFVNGETTATIGGKSFTNFTVVSATQITGTTPSSSAGSVDVVITTPGGTVTATDGFTYLDPPTITSISPSSGDSSGSESITITGSNFSDGNTTVTFGSTSANISSISSDGTTISLTTPSGSAGTVDVIVETPGGTVTETGGFTYFDDPTISTISPSEGSTSGGETITIAGSNFASGNTSVDIGSNTVAAADVTVTGTTQLTFTLPANSAGTVNVTVNTPGGSATSNGAFTYLNAPTISNISPDEGPSTGGGTITITGEHFVAGGTSVDIGNTNIPSSNVSVTVNPSADDTLTFTLPSNSQSSTTSAVDVKVTTNGGIATVTDGFTYYLAPSITSLSPDEGPQSGSPSTTVTITGNNFVDGKVSVDIGTNSISAGNVTFISSTQVSFTLPTNSGQTAITDAVNVTVTTPGGTGTLTDGFTYYLAPTISSINVVEGPASGSPATTITVTGNNFVNGKVSVSFGSNQVDATNVTFINSTQVSCTLPANSSQTATTDTVDVSVDSPGGTGNLSNGFTYYLAPTVTNISPNEGPASGSPATTITITGSNFVSGKVSVDIGSNSIATGDVTFNSSTEIEVTLPANSSQSAITDTVDVSVTSPGGTGTETGGFTYYLAPTVTSLDVVEGPASGTPATTITITGTNFISGKVSIDFGSNTVSTSNVTFISSTQVSCTLPANSGQSSTTDTVNVSATSPGGTGTLSSAFTYYLAPTITNVSPNEGPASGSPSTTVTITGTNFVSGKVSVDIGSSTIGTGSVTFNTSTEISVTLPANSGQSAITEMVDVSVTSPGGTGTETDGFTYYLAPTITSLNITEGPASGTPSTTVTITGTNFVNGKVSIDFGSNTVSSSNVTFISSTQVSCTLPANSSQTNPTDTVNVSATSPGGTGTLSSAFTYYLAPTVTNVNPNEGPASGSPSTTVTITGTNFVNGKISVDIGSNSISSSNVTFNSSTEIEVTLPANSGQTSITNLVDVSATSPGGTGTLTDGFTYYLAPTISAVNPTKGPSSGSPSTTVTITGTNFVNGKVSVTFGSNTVTASNVTFNNSTELEVTLPANSGQTATEVMVDVNVDSPGGTGTLTDGFTYQLAPIISSISPNEGPASGTPSTTVTINGSNFVNGENTVTIGGTTIGTSSVTFVSSSQIQVTLPSNSGQVTATDQVDVTVTSTTTGASDTETNGFTYYLAPTILSLSPTKGPASGSPSTTVTITGTNFVSGKVSVDFGSNNVSATNVTFNSSTEIEVTLPANSGQSAITEMVNVSVTSPGGSDTETNGFTYYLAPTVSTVSPTEGPASGTPSTTVTITGTNFVNGEVSVDFGSNNVSASNVTFNSNTEIEVTLPANSGQSAITETVSVSVTSPGGTGTKSSAFTYYLAPTITAVSPGKGPASGSPSTTVTITGTNFVSGKVSVDFGSNNVSASNVTFNSSTEIEVTLPANSGQSAITETVNVSVTSPGGSDTLNSSFTYYLAPTITNISPVEGSTNGGDSITITGTNFVSGDMTVTFGGSAGSSVNVTVTSNPTELTVTTPTGTAGMVDVVVSSPGGSDTVTDGFTYIAPPTVSAVSPTEGSTDGGESITITGTNFTSVSDVKFGSTSGTNISVTSTTELTVDTPTGLSAGTVDVSVTTPGGTGTKTGAFTFFDPPTVTNATPNIDDLAGGKTITLTGTNFQSVSDVKFGSNSGSNITVNSTTELTVTAPSASSSGTVDVTVTTPGGTGTLSGGFTYDSQTPTFSGISSATAIGGSSIELKWTAATDNITATSDIIYRIYQSTTSGSFTFSQPDFTTEAGETSFIVGNLSPSTTYFFAVRAVDEAGNEDTNVAEASDITSSAPSTSTASLSATLTAKRKNHSTTLLPDGRILIVGGSTNTATLSTAEIYNPLTGTFTATASLNTARSKHTATLLPNGKVLIAGGSGSSGVVTTDEIYDPSMGTFTNSTNSLNTPREEHTATLLATGDVLLAGGTGSSGILASGEIFSPGGQTFTVTSGSLSEKRRSHTATLLSDGKVLLIGGFDGTNNLASAEIYDPSTNTFTVAASLNTARRSHTATLLPNNTVLITGGTGSAGRLNGGEIYDVDANSFSLTQTGGGTTTTLNTARDLHTANLLPNGKVLLAGGRNSSGTSLASLEVYDPSAGTFTNLGVSLSQSRFSHTAILLSGGKIMVAGGADGSSSLDSGELINSIGLFSYNGASLDGRTLHTATLLSTGKVLIAGGNNSGATNSTQIYDPLTDTFSATTGSLTGARYGHTATLLANGKVLITGGTSDGSDPLTSNTGQLYDSSSGNFTATDNGLSDDRFHHTATLLPTGQVLIVGGNRGASGAGITDRVERYDPSSGTNGSFASNGGGNDLSAARAHHTATLLTDNTVLVTGGINGSSTVLASAELYSVSGNSWSDTEDGGGATTTLNTARYNHTATLLPNGDVLIVGGNTGSGILASAEIYDSSAGTFSTLTGTLNNAREKHTATLLPNGKVLIAGGHNGSTSVSALEIYDPATQSFSSLATGTARSEHTATVLPTGRVLLVGGGSATTDLIIEDLGFATSWRPVIETVNSSSSFPVSISFGVSTTVTGLRFRGISGASGGQGHQNSPTSAPFVYLLKISGGGKGNTSGTNFGHYQLSSSSFSETSFDITLPSSTNNAPGYYLMTVFVNGIPSESRIIKLQ